MSDEAKAIGRVADAILKLAQAVSEHSDTVNAASHRLMGFLGYEGCSPTGTLDLYVRDIKNAIEGTDHTFEIQQVAAAIDGLATAVVSKG